MATDRFHTKQPIDCGGLKINGTEIITSAGAIKGDIQATAGSIGEAELANLAVTEGKIGNLAVTSGKIGANAVITAKIADGAVTEEKIGNLAVTSGKIGANAVITAKIADDAVTSDKIDQGVIQTIKKTLTATTLVGTDSGDIGHTDGFVILANQGANTVTEVISAVLVYNFDTAAYTGGGDDMVIRSATTALTPVIAKADLVGAAEDKIVMVMPSAGAADVALTANNVINLSGTAFTQPGTAAGTLDVYLTYRVHTIA